MAGAEYAACALEQTLRQYGSTRRIPRSLSPDNGASCIPNLLK